MKLIAVFLVLNSALQVPGLSQAQGWRGIVPLVSTRTDVQRLLNSTSNPECVLSLCTYYLADMNVQFYYSPGDCKSGLGVWDVPLDTVVGITVHLRSRPQLADLGVDETHFEIKRMGDDGLLYYVHESQGLTLEVHEGHVQTLRYGPVAKDRHLRCP